MKYYWYCECFNCRQGRLLIMEDVTNRRLYLHCEECEYGWYVPEKINSMECGFLTLTEDFDSSTPTFEDIKNYGWEKYATHSFSD